MTDTVIRVETLGKRYRIGARETEPASLRESIGTFIGSTFRYLRDMRRPPTEEETLWALRDVSFEVKRGEIVGIIGRNGAGKSTLLKIMSRITEPTEGRITIDGRVGSLLEVGTGFHPELTGRENVYLNGAILGMKKREIDRKFDEIVEFSEIEKFLDTPVKRYSSGMYVRLAFGVAAHLEPEILIVDEVLAVGDTAFQQKCLGKIGEVARGGRTVLLVSHNMASVARLSTTGIWMDKGQLRDAGNIADLLARYATAYMQSKAMVEFPQESQKRVQIRSVKLLDHTGAVNAELDRLQSFSAAIEYEVRDLVANVRRTIMLDKADGTPICHSAETDMSPDGVVDLEPGLHVAHITFPGGLLNSGTYQIRVGVVVNGATEDYQEALFFNLHDFGTFAAKGVGNNPRLGLLAFPLEWNTRMARSLIGSHD